MASGGATLTSQVAAGLKSTLNKIVTDDTEVRSQLDYDDFCEEYSMEDAYEDDQEYGGLGLVAEFAEGQEIPVAGMDEGYAKRYIARNFGLQMIVTEQALEDNKYPKIINAAGRLRRAYWMGVQYDATQLLVRAQNSAYVGGDGVVLWSASHTLPGGGTWSNLMSTTYAPGTAALSAARTQISHFPSQDGTLAAAQLTAVGFPSDQWAAWSGVLKSTLNPVAGNAAEINVFKSQNIDLIECRFWQSTTTQSFFKTNVTNGIQVRWRRKMTTRSWVENSNMQMHYAVTGRWTTGWTDARSILGNPA